MKQKQILLALLFFAAPLFAIPGRPETAKEIEMIEFVKESVELAEKNTSKLTPEVLALPGEQNFKIRHLLNHLCSRNNTHFLEIGVSQGAMWISALYGNQKMVSEAVAIDILQVKREEEFQNTCTKFLGTFPYKFCNGDCFTVDKKAIFTHPINLYFCAGKNLVNNKERAFSYYNEILDDAFTVVIDEWDLAVVKMATLAAIKQLKYDVLFFKQVPGNRGPQRSYGSGTYIAVLRKAK